MPLVSRRYQEGVLKMSMSVMPTLKAVYAVGRFGRNINPETAAVLLKGIKNRFDFHMRDLNPPPELKPEVASSSFRFKETVEEAQEHGLKVVAGTVTTPERAEVAKNLGIFEIVAPDLNEEVGRVALQHELRYVPGISWATELGLLGHLVKEGKVRKPSTIKVFPFQCGKEPIEFRKALQGPFGDEIENLPSGKVIRLSDPVEDRGYDVEKIRSGEIAYAHTPAQFAAALRSDKAKIIVIGSPPASQGLDSFHDLLEYLEEKVPELAGIPLGAFGGVRLENVADLIRGGVTVFGTGSDLLGKEIVEEAAKGNFAPVNEKVDLLAQQIHRGLAVLGTVIA